MRARKVRAKSITFRNDVLNISDAWFTCIARAYWQVFRERAVPILTAKLLPGISFNKTTRFMLKQIKSPVVDFQSVNPEVRRHYKRLYPNWF